MLREFVIDSHVTSAPSSKRALMLCKHAVLFCQISWPRLKRNLPETWAYLNTWEEGVPVQMRTPLPLPVLLAMCILARSLACQVSGRSAQLWLCHAALLEVAFFTMLRPGELFKLRVGDVATVSSWNLGMPHCTLRLRRPKNRRHMGFEQFVTLTHPSACNWLAVVTHGRRSTERLWPSTAAEFRERFADLWRKLKLQDVRLSPASLRAGGASFKFQSGVPISSIRFLGRWASEAALKHYIQGATAQQLLLRMPLPAITRLKRLLQSGFEALSVPRALTIGLPTQHLLRVRVALSVPTSGEEVVAACYAYGLSRIVR